MHGFQRNVPPRVHAFVFLVHGSSQAGQLGVGDPGAECTVLGSCPCQVAAATVASSCLGGPGANPGSMAPGSGKGGWSSVLWQVEQALASQLCHALETTGLWMNMGLCLAGPLWPEALPPGPQSWRKQSRSSLTAMVLTLGLPTVQGLLRLYHSHSHMLSQALTLRCFHDDKASLGVDSLRVYKSYLHTRS